MSQLSLCAGVDSMMSIRLSSYYYY